MGSPLPCTISLWLLVVASVAARFMSSCDDKKWAGSARTHEEHEIHSQLIISGPPVPKCRRPLRSEAIKEIKSSNNNFQSFTPQMAKQLERSRQNSSNLSVTKELSRDLSISNDTQITESSGEDDEEQLHHSQNRSKTISPEKNISKRLNCSTIVSPEKDISKKYKFEKESFSKETQNSNSLNKYSLSRYIYFGLLFIFAIVIGLFFIYSIKTTEVQTQSINNPTLLLSESIKDIKATFYHQESDIWNDISSAINEVVSRTPKVPSIILLFAKETITMDCLATKLAEMSSDILQADKYLIFKPEHFGNDAGEIINALNKLPLKKKKVVMINDILNINAEAIKDLHNLCDRINPLVAEAVYILTMQTNNYQSQQKKLKFVENQISDKLSKSIDQDVLMALVTRITDGVIISVQPEPQLRYC